MKMSKYVAKLLGGLTLGLSACTAFAGATWGLNFASNCGSLSSGSYYNSITCSTAATGTVTATAVSTNSTATTATFQAAQLSYWGTGSGLGVKNPLEASGSPNHALDNYLYTDMILLNFGSTKVNLSTVTLGWWANDYDITVMAYTGTATTPPLTSKTIAQVGAGWSSVSNYGNNSASATNTGGTDTDKTLALGASGVYSSWWLISAYNSGFGGTPLGDSIADYVKVLSVAGQVQDKPPPPPGVPEPGSLAMMALALAGMVAVQRRRRQQAASGGHAAAAPA